MHLLKYNPDAKTLTEVPPSEFDADPTCRYFYVLGKRAHVPIVTPDGIGKIVWEHPSYQPPKPANQHRATKEINGDDQPVQQFIAKYLFTASNILQDSFLFNFASSVLFDLCINGEHLAPGDGIKIAHRPGEVPVSGVYSTINYKVASVSKVDDGVWTVRAVRVGTSDSEPAPTADDLDAVAAAGAHVGRSSAAVDPVLALQDQIRDGSLTLAEALEKINGEPIERTRQTTYLVEKIRVRMIQEQKNSNSWQAVAEAVLREVAEWLRHCLGQSDRQRG
jgi:hypothetical protein